MLLRLFAASGQDMLPVIQAENLLMAKASKGAVTVAELGGDPARVVRRVRSSKEPLLVMQRGRAQVVLMSVEAYQRAQPARARASVRACSRGARDRGWPRFLARERSRR